MKNKESNSLFIIILIITIILGVYLIVSIYFTKHFYIGTYINGINVSCKTLNEANDKLLEESYNYVLELSERNNITEYIEGNNINFKYEDSNEIEKVKEKQNAFLWPRYVLLRNEYNINNLYSYDKELLDKEFNKLSCFNKESIIEPLDASFRYENGEYTIIKEIYGNKVNKDYLYAYVINSIS